MGIIAIEGLVKQYGDIEALRGLNLDMEKGIFGFIGPNGSGKTTTIKILIGALKADGGKAAVFGYNSATQSLDIRRRVGVLHENPMYPKEMTGFGYLVFVGQLYGLPKREANAKAAWLLNQIGLSEVGDRPIGKYSAGMRQRLGIAQALVGEPELVMLDEPTANLDPLGRMQLIELIARLRKEHGVSFFISSHSLAELQKVCDQICVIHRGVSLEQGKVEDIIAKYAENIYHVVVSEPYALLEELNKTGLVSKATVKGNTVIMETNDPTRLYEEVGRVTKERKLQLHRFQHASYDLETIFKRVIGEAK